MTKTFYALRSKKSGKFWDLGYGPSGRWVKELHEASWLDDAEDWLVASDSEVVAVDATGKVRK